MTARVIARLNGATVTDGKRTGRIVAQSVTAPLSDRRPEGPGWELVFWFSEVSADHGPHDSVPAETYQWVKLHEVTILRVHGRDLWMHVGHTFKSMVQADAGTCVYCEKPIVYAMCDNGSKHIPAGHTEPASTYSAWFHADGSPGHLPGGTSGGGFWVQPAPPRCSQCGGQGD
jgi:hypothetical protein